MSISFKLPIFIAFLCFSARSMGTTQEKPYPSSYNEQDRPNLSSNNPMKGFSKFVVFAMCSSRTKKSSEKLLKLVEQELKKYGQVNTPKMLIQTDRGEEIDLTSLSNGVTLIYQIQNVTDPQGKDLGIVRASLNLSTGITIDKTKEGCSPYIWTSNCFLKGSTADHLEELVARSIKSLLEQFSISFSAVNPNKPIFDLQGLN